MSHISNPVTVYACPENIELAPPDNELRVRNLGNGWVVFEWAQDPPESPADRTLEEEPRARSSHK